MALRLESSHWVVAWGWRRSGLKRHHHLRNLPLPGGSYTEHPGQGLCQGPRAKRIEAAATLKERTLTNLYNERPQWLENAHAELDRAVAAAYGWPEDIASDEAPEKLLALNLARACK